ncbi:hypothetical protein ACFH04_27940 [Streptomyces noboritoensis]|uniref:Uncharacterized protein n=1 Tax=Streptomyces noboritoensis TaxID=67337 RepID=A0ABV6TP28_9ACTN
MTSMWRASVKKEKPREDGSHAFASATGSSAKASSSPLPAAVSLKSCSPSSCE